MKLDIIIPVYRNAPLVDACIESLNAHLDEIAAFDVHIIAINDSPDDRETSALLQRLHDAGKVHVLIVNASNVGFVQSVNHGLAMARERKAAALLVNSDTRTYQGTLAEMLRVMEIDPQIGFVCPRSNNASISTFPPFVGSPDDRATTPAQDYAAWQALHHHLPRFTWAPTAVGFYMLIAPDVVLNFTPLDESFGVGYEEENDLVMRAGKVGYRAVLANHAYAYHAGSASFLLREIDLKEQRDGNLRKMTDRHPEFLPLVRHYEGSPGNRAELALRHLLPGADGKVKIALNLLTFGEHHNGTSEHMMHFIRWCDRAAPGRFDIDVICRPAVAAFHGIDKLRRIKSRPDYSPGYALALFPGQPFSLQTIQVMERLAPLNVYGMLDVIALDCGNLRAADDLETLWAHVARHASGLFFNSRFSERTFRNRFPRQFTARSYAQLLPTKLTSYRTHYAGIVQSADHVLVMGNHFAHKGSEEAGARIAAALPDVPLTILGGRTASDGKARTVQAGVIPSADMNMLMARSAVVVLPSYYEGFGLALIHALALGKPVVARDIPPTREILATYADVSGVHLFSANNEIAGLVEQAMAEGESRVSEMACIDWDIWSKGLFDFCEALLAEPHLHARLVDRLTASDALRGIGLASGGGEASAPVKDDVVRISEILRLDGEAFVHAFYNRLMGRPADPAGLEHHIALLDGGMTKVHLLKAILTAQEFLDRTDVTVLERHLLYKRRWSRVFSDWFKNIRQDASEKTPAVLAQPDEPVAVAASAAPAAAVRQVSVQPVPAAATPSDDVIDIGRLLELDDADFVSTAYRQLLGREAEQQGYDHHIALLDSGTRKADILSSFLQSPEFAAREHKVTVIGRSLLDRGKGKRRKMAFANASRPAVSAAAKPLVEGSVIHLEALFALDREPFVAALYEHLLGRPAGKDEAMHYRRLLARGTPKADLVRSFIASEEFTGRADAPQLTGQHLLRAR